MEYEKGKDCLASQFQAWGDESYTAWCDIIKIHRGTKLFRQFTAVSLIDYDRAKTALGHRFKFMDIEELCGLELHRKDQGDQNIEALGAELQTLGSKAFLSICGHELDRPLKKGRFFQALDDKWQGNLGAPKTGDVQGVI